MCVESHRHTRSRLDPYLTTACGQFKEVENDIRVHDADGVNKKNSRRRANPLVFALLRVVEEERRHGKCGSGRHLTHGQVDSFDTHTHTQKAKKKKPNPKQINLFFDLCLLD